MCTNTADASADLNSLLLSRVPYMNIGLSRVRCAATQSDLSINGTLIAYDPSSCESGVPEVYRVY